MKTNILTPKDLFQKDIRYTIPPFQRRYVWTLEDQWEPLWEDVRNTAEYYLENLNKHGGEKIPAEQETKAHFLGAVVIQQVNTATPDIERREVIDGQQRITTIQILLDAIQYVFEKKELKKGVAKRLSKLVKNDEDLTVKEEDIFKLWPTKGDRDAFTHAMRNESSVDGYEDSLIVRAHEFFQGETKEWIDSGEEETQSRMEALEIAVTGKLHMVVIDLDSHDDANVIFETLNARGTPLMQSDLIKNYVMSELETDDDAIWSDLDEDWWRKDIRQGRLMRPRIDALLDYWLEMKTGYDVSASAVFKSFKELSSGRRIEDVMSEITRDLGNYRLYEEGDRNKTEDIFYYRSNVMQMAAFTPVLIALLSKSEYIRDGALKALESFLIRRMVCRYTTKDYSRLSLDLVRELNKSKYESADQIVIDFLTGQESASRCWPTDMDLKSAFTTYPLYNRLTRGRMRLILEAIEEHYRKDPLTEPQPVSRNLPIEHVLPQSWEANWPLPPNIDEDKARHTRKQHVHLIGNLTLVTSKLNSKLSNAPWEQKKATLDEHSVLLMNRRLLSDYKERVWKEETIVERSEQMAGLVAEIWPGPDRIDL